MSFLYNTGMRLNQVTCLKIKDIDSKVEYILFYLTGMDYMVLQIQKGRWTLYNLFRWGAESKGRGLFCNPHHYPVRDIYQRKVYRKVERIWYTDIYIGHPLWKNLWRDKSGIQTKKRDWNNVRFLQKLPKSRPVAHAEPLCARGMAYRYLNGHGRLSQTVHKAKRCKKNWTNTLLKIS